VLEFKYPSFESTELSEKEIAMLLKGPSDVPANVGAAEQESAASETANEPVDALTAFLEEPMSGTDELDDFSIEQLNALLGEADPQDDGDTPVDEDPPEEPQEEPEPPRKRTKLTYYGLILIFASVFLLCAVYLGKYFTSTLRAQDQYDQLASLHQQATGGYDPTDPTLPSGEIVPTAPGETRPQVMLPEMKAIYELNSDLVGWIQIPQLKIDYPVTQTPNSRDFYLYRDFYKRDNETGCLYVRENCDVFRPSDNVVIYGHAMKTGSMFGRLYKYQTKSYWEENQYFTFDTLYERHTYQIFAVFLTSGIQQDKNGKPYGYPYHRKNDFKDAADFDQFIADIKGAAFTGENAYVGRALYDTGITPQYGDKLLCLSTCEYTIDDGRLVVMAVRVS